jgi:hypothetical protein
MKRKVVGLILVLIVSFIFQFVVYGQSVMPWFWDYETPSTFTDIDMIPCPSEHAKNYPLDYFTFLTAIENVENGNIVFLPSHWKMSLYFSLEGVPESKVAEWRGAHFHDRPTDKDHIRVTLGGIGTVPPSDDSDNSPSAVEFASQTGIETIRMLKPEAAGVIRFHGECELVSDTSTTNFCAYSDENDAWQKVEGSDPSCSKAWLAEWAYFYEVRELVELPESGDDVFYVRARTAEGGNNPYHPNPYAYYARQEMVNALMQLAKDYYEDQSTKEQKLRFKDMSLEWGGLFDLDGNWTCSHVRHRTGKSVDVGTTTTKIEGEQRFARL